MQRAAKEPLSPERIEVAALELIEAEGMAGFSTRKLAGMLGREAMSIYHYFPSKEHLLDALVDRVMGSELTVLDPTVRDWRRALEGSAQEWRRMGAKHPHFFGYLVNHRLNTPTALRWLNSLLGLFQTVSPSEELAVRSFRALGYFLAGAVLDETAGYARGPSTVAPVPDAVMAAEYPFVVKAGRWFREDQWDATFELGLAAHLDAFEAGVKASSF
jgi:AcrR family transcriptional regulator